MIQPIKSNEMCEHCAQHRIMRGGQVFVFLVMEPNFKSVQQTQKNLHAQCVGPFLLANEQCYIARTQGDPAQLDIEGQKAEAKELDS